MSRREVSGERGRQADKAGLSSASPRLPGRSLRADAQLCPLRAAQGSPPVRTAMLSPARHVPATLRAPPPGVSTSFNACGVDPGPRLIPATRHRTARRTDGARRPARCPRSPARWTAPGVPTACGPHPLRAHHALCGCAGTSCTAARFCLEPETALKYSLCEKENGLMSMWAPFLNPKLSTTQRKATGLSDCPHSGPAVTSPSLPPLSHLRLLPPPLSALGSSLSLFFGVRCRSLLYAY